MFYLINTLTGEIINESEKKGALRREQKKADDKKNLKVSKFKVLAHSKQTLNKVAKVIGKLHSDRLKRRRDKNQGEGISLRKAIRRGYNIYPEMPTKLYLR